jgi:hypothetical protein
MPNLLVNSFAYLARLVEAMQHHQQMVRRHQLEVGLLGDIDQRHQKDVLQTEWGLHEDLEGHRYYAVLWTNLTADQTELYCVQYSDQTPQNLHPYMNHHFPPLRNWVRQKHSQLVHHPPD